MVNNVCTSEGKIDSFQRIGSLEQFRTEILNNRLNTSRCTIVNIYYYIISSICCSSSI